MAQLYLRNLTQLMIQNSYSTCTEKMKILNDNEEDELVELDAQASEVDNIEADAYDEILLTQPLLMKDGTISRAKKLEGKEMNMVIQ
jgi:hypothetical protein